MAAVRDLVLIVREYGAWSFFKRLYNEINEDNVFTNAAAMAYAWMFAVFPFVIFLLTLIPYLPFEARKAAMAMTDRVLSESLTSSAAGTIMPEVTKNVGDVVNHPRKGLLSVGLLLTLFAASGGMNATMAALDQAFDVDKPRKYIWKRLVAMMLTIFMCICLLVIALMIPVGEIVTDLLKRYADKLPLWASDLVDGRSLMFLTAARYIIGLTVMQILIGVIYHFGRSRRANRIRFFTPGSIFAAGGWIATGIVMRVYVENYANYSKVYGAVAGMVIMLMIFYVNAIIILIGAEIDSEIRHLKSEMDSHFREGPSSSRPHA